jgi:hypothetical protein
MIECNMTKCGHITDLEKEVQAERERHKTTRRAVLELMVALETARGEAVFAKNACSGGAMRTIADVVADIHGTTIDGLTEILKLCDGRGE